MNHYKKIGIVILILTVLANSFALGTFQVWAHQVTLDVVYDNCNYLENDDGIDEKWYLISIPTEGWHCDHNESTITYRFEEIPENSVILDNPNISEAVIDEIKTAYANSMKKWNNVYFYSYNPDGTITKNKIINIVEADPNDAECNITISFATNMGIEIANTAYVNDSVINPNEDVVYNKHCSKFIMTVNIDYFYINGLYTKPVVSAIKERTGAHEMGHVLGLIDIDLRSLCEPMVKNMEIEIPDHHEEVLMGYGEDLASRAKDITYKDIAGVAITRGFHTDADHKWLNAGLQSDGTYKLICSICNGVKYVNSLSGLTYNTYGACNGNHERSSGNMMAVASYGNKDYYKCKYCRKVMPFSAIAEQDYSAVPVTGGTHHMVTNNVTGLNYSFLEEHRWIGGECADCGLQYPHSHTYTYTDRNSMFHIKSCDCGYSANESHFIKNSDIVNGRYANCLGCGRLIDLNKDNAMILPTAITKVSANGSYILPNGIVVLVDEDVDAYLNGTLIFYNRDDIPTTE